MKIMDFCGLVKFMKTLNTEKIEYIIYFIYFLLAFIYPTAWGSQGCFLIVFKICRYLIYLCFLIILVKRFKQKEYQKKLVLFIFVLLMLFFGVSMFISKKNDFFIFLVFLITIYKKDFKRLLKLAFIAQSLILIVTITFSLVGLTENIVFDELRNRYSLGFDYVTFSQVFLLFIIFEYTYVFEQTIWSIVFFLLASIILFVLCDTKLTFALSLFFLISYSVLKFFPNARKKVCVFVCKFKKTIIFSPIIAATLAFIQVIFYNPESSFWGKLNSILSYRLGLGSNALKKYGVSLLGQNILFQGTSLTKELSGEYNYVDSSYLRIGIQQGVIVLCAIIAFYLFALYRAYKCHDLKLIGILVIILFLCIEEPFLFDVTFNVFPIVAFTKIGIKNDPIEIV